MYIRVTEREKEVVDDLWHLSEGRKWFLVRTKGRHILFKPRKRRYTAENLMGGRRRTRDRGQSILRIFQVMKLAQNFRGQNLDHPGSQRSSVQPTAVQVNVLIANGAINSRIGTRFRILLSMPSQLVTVIWSESNRTIHVVPISCHWDRVEVSGLEWG